MITVELIYDTDCPNFKDARTQLLRGFAEVGLPPRWQEWNRRDPESPPYVRNFGSPTILVNGQDVAGAVPVERADCCRLYRADDGQLRGAPSVETISAALLKNKEASPGEPIHDPTRRAGWGRTLATLPAMGLALLPSLTCPACWPAYAGLLSALGLGFANYTPYLLPLTILFLAIAVASLAYRAKGRRGYRPFILGIAAAVTVIVGKFVLASDSIMYVGIAMLVGGSLWNFWLRRTNVGVPCHSCAPAGTPGKTGSTDPFERNETMTAKRTIEIFNAGCPLCQETVELVNRLACPSCSITIRDMNDPDVARQAKDLGVRSVPAVVIDGKLAECCAGRGPNEAALRTAGIGDE